MKEKETKTHSSDPLDTLHTSVITVNTELRVAAADHFFEKMFSVKKEDCLGKEISNVIARIFSKKDCSKITELIRKAIATEYRQRLDKIRRSNKRRGAFTITLTINPLADPMSGQIMGVTMFFIPAFVKGRILVAEDEPNMRKLLCDILSTEYEVVTAADGLSAKEKLKKNPFDIVIADLKMPKMSGKELIEYIHKEVSPDIINIIITAYKEVWSPTDATDQHVFHYFVKGDFEPKDIKKVVHNAIELRKLRLVEKDHYEQLTEVLSRTISNMTVNLRASNHILQRTKEKLETIINIMPDGLFTVDSGRRILSFNPMAELITEYKASEVLGKECTVLVIGGCEKACPLLKEKARKGILDKECQLISKTGKEVPILLNTSPVMGHTGKPIGSVETIKDISELKKLERIIAQSAKMAGIGELAAGIAHNLRSPMAAIKSYPEAILDELKSKRLKIYRIEGKQQIEDEHIREWLETMRNSMTKCFGIINTLLGFSKVRPTEEMSDIAIKDVIKDVETLLVDELTLRNIKLTKKVPKNIAVSGNLSQLTQIFVGLFTNAWQAMPEGGTLTISARRRVDVDEERYVEIKVKDTGQGIEEKHLNKIFEPFFTTRENGHSIGMGLSLCYDMIKSHGGSISVASKVDKGTTFTIKLPSRKR